MIMNSEFDKFCEEHGIIRFREALYHQLRAKGHDNPSKDTLEREWGCLVSHFLEVAEVGILDE